MIHQITTDSICQAIASGTFIDSLMRGKPVIGLHTRYLDYYLEDSEVPVFLCKNEEELATYIQG